MTNKKYAIAPLSLLVAFFCNAQDTIVNTTLVYDPHQNKLIPDKVFEFGIPMILLVIILNTIVTVIKNRADQQLKLKMIEKPVSEETLVQVFKESNAISKLQPLKYFLFSAAVGVSFIIIHMCKDYLRNQSGYLAIGIVLVLTSIASYIYYRILQNKI